MADRPTTILTVEGMTCPSCVRHISQALGDLAGVGKVDVQLRAGLVAIEHDPAAAPVAALIDAIALAGYAARPRPV